MTDSGPATLWPGPSVLAWTGGLSFTMLCRRAAAQDASSAPDQPSRTHTAILAGKVVDDERKQVKGATVVLTDSQTRYAISTESEGKGKYQFAKLGSRLL